MWVTVRPRYDEAATSLYAYTQVVVVLAWEISIAIKNSALLSLLSSNIFICHVQNPDASDTQCARIYMYEQNTESSNAGYV